MSDVCRAIPTFWYVKKHFLTSSMGLIIFKTTVSSILTGSRNCYIQTMNKDKHQLDAKIFLLTLQWWLWCACVCVGVHVCDIVYYFFQSHNSVKSRCYMNDSNELLNSLILMYAYDFSEVWTFESIQSKQTPGNETDFLKIDWI